MRIREILREDPKPVDRFTADLNILLTGAKGSGSEALNTEDLVTQLQQGGHTVDVDSFLSYLQQFPNPRITGATPEVINLQTPKDDQAKAASSGSGQDNAEHVSSLAQKANTL